MYNVCALKKFASMGIKTVGERDRQRAERVCVGESVADKKNIYIKKKGWWGGENVKGGYKIDKNKEKILLCHEGWGCEPCV